MTFSHQHNTFLLWLRPFLFHKITCYICLNMINSGYTNLRNRILLLVTYKNPQNYINEKKAMHKNCSI